MPRPRHLVLYDGVCGLCDRLTRFVLARDRRDRFRFAALQGEAGRDWLARMGGDVGTLETVVVVAAFDSDTPRLLLRSEAAFFLLRELGGPWRALSWFDVLPRRMLDAAYGFVARRRYGWFGRFDSCPVPDASVRAKFLDRP